MNKIQYFICNKYKNQGSKVKNLKFQGNKVLLQSNKLGKLSTDFNVTYNTATQLVTVKKHPS